MSRSRRRSGAGVRLTLAAVVGLGAAIAWGTTGCESIFGIGELPLPGDGGAADRLAVDGPSGDGPSGRDTGSKPGPDSGPPCTPTVAYTPVPWAPPTADMQPACTLAQLSLYETCYPNCDNFRNDEANAACVSCIETDVGAVAHGPVITQSKNGVVAPILVNVGGCQALADQMPLSGGCGDQENRSRGCLSTECGTCSDFSDPAASGPTAMCEAVAETGECSSYMTDPSCDAELAPGGVAADCLTLSMFLGTWCVPPGAPPSCDAKSTFDPPPWAPPTAFGQGLCTSQQVDDYLGCFPNCSSFAADPSNSTCLSCIQTDEASSAYGPIVTSGGTPTQVNFGGCLADAEDAGTCGQTINDFNACASAECGTCSDFANPTQGGPTEQCEASEFLMGSCSTYNDMACFGDVGDAGGAAACSNLATFLPLWCGSMTDGGVPPIDSGPIDTGTSPIDSGTPPIDSGSGPSDSGSTLDGG